MKTRHKKAKDENFPVSGFLIRKDLRKIVELYYQFARFADDIADNPKLTPKTKIDKLNELEEIFDGQKKYKGEKLKFALDLRQEFIKNQLDRSLVTDLLVAFRQDAIGFDYETIGQLVNYCTYSAAPVGRFLLAIYNENPSSYLPANSLCAALQIVNHLQDIKYDAINLKRIYIPSELLKKYGIEKNVLTKDKSSEGLKHMVRKLLDLVKGQLKEGELLLNIVKSRRLRLEIAVIISLTNILIKKIIASDVLTENIKLTKWNKICGLISGCLRFLNHKKYTLPKGKL